MLFNMQSIIFKFKSGDIKCFGCISTMRQVNIVLPMPYSQIGRVFGIESELLSPAETRRRWPLIECDTLYGALHSPTDGTIDPAAYCLALTRAAQSRGAQV